MTGIALAVLLLAASAFPCFAADKGLDPATLLKPATDAWPTFNGDYSGRRYSTLSQINQSNVKQLSLAWVMQLKSVAIKSMPLQINGILYISSPDNVWAADAHDGRIIWHYNRPTPETTLGIAAWACTRTSSTSKQPTVTCSLSRRKTAKFCGTSNWPIRSSDTSPRWRR